MSLSIHGSSRLCASRLRNTPQQKCAKCRPSKFRLAAADHSLIRLSGRGRPPAFIGLSQFAPEPRPFEACNWPTVAVREFFCLLHCLTRSTPKLRLYRVCKLPEAFDFPRSCKKSNGHVTPTVRYLLGEPERSSRIPHPHCEWRVAIGIQE